MSVSLEAVFKQLSDRSYCLWVGSGVTTYLCQAGGGAAVSWKSLTEGLEEEAGISKPAAGSGYPARLQVCKERLGEQVFRSRVHQAILGATRECIISAAARNDGPATNDLVPVQVRNLARLGLRASSIVNFNLESWTSDLLAAPGGPFTIRTFFSPSVSGAKTVIARNGRVAGRSVYHPHGALVISGATILTEAEYKLLDPSLAFQLAVHLAFQSELVIVGMSLEDDYLRNQIEKFRSYIGPIIWFCSSPPTDGSELAKWVKVNRVEVVLVAQNWSDFWQAVGEFLPQPRELLLVDGWYRVVSNAWHEPMYGGELWGKVRRAEEAAAEPERVKNLQRVAEASGEQELADAPSFFVQLASNTTNLNLHKRCKLLKSFESLVQHRSECELLCDVVDAEVDSTLKKHPVVF